MSKINNSFPFCKGNVFSASRDFVVDSLAVKKGDILTYVGARHSPNTKYKVNHIFIHGMTGISFQLNTRPYFLKMDLDWIEGE